MCLEDKEIIESIEYNESAKDYVKVKRKVNEKIEQIEEAITEISCLMDFEDKIELKYLRTVLTNLKQELRLERGKHD